jgi:UDP-N-acetylglucosamine diphosphorylase/glucosamine-1-phosphate N-acetyltransferase
MIIMSDNLVVTIMSAGEGKRMRSNIPKVLHIFKEKPMLVRIIETARQLNPTKIIVITGKYNDLIKETVSKYTNTDDIIYVRQREPLGTGDAIKSCLPYYKNNEKVLILNGDMPLINREVLEKFIKNMSDMNILVARFSNPIGYGRIIYDENNEFTEIVEEKDCNEEQRKVEIVNSGLYYINSNLLKKYVPLIENKNIQQEYYLTDLVKIIKTNTNMSINAHLIDKNENKYISGINTPEELTRLEISVDCEMICNELRYLEAGLEKNNTILLDIENSQYIKKKLNDISNVLNQLNKILY